MKTSATIEPTDQRDVDVVAFDALGLDLAELEADRIGGLEQNSGDGSVSLIDRLTYAEVKRYPIGKEPHHLMMTPDNKELIVANASSNELVFLD